MLPGDHIESGGVIRRQSRSHRWPASSMVDPHRWGDGQKDSLEGVGEPLGRPGILDRAGSVDRQLVPLDRRRPVAGVEETHVTVELGEGAQVLDLARWLSEEKRRRQRGSQDRRHKRQEPKFARKKSHGPASVRDYIRL